MNPTSEAAMKGEEDVRKTRSQIRNAGLPHSSRLESANPKGSCSGQFRVVLPIGG
jgi:hypothetical protein